jgi:hypothetical protein
MERSTRVAGSIPTALTNLRRTQHFAGASDTNKAFDTNCTILQRTLRSALIGSPQHRALDRQLREHTHAVLLGTNLYWMFFDRFGATNSMVEAHRARFV